MANLTTDTIGAAQHLGLAASTLEKMRVYGGGPPFIKLGRVVRYRVTDLETYLDNRVVDSTSATPTVAKTSQPSDPRHANGSN